MLAQEVMENEAQWLNYEFEDAQVKIDLSDMILEHLVEEFVGYLNTGKWPEKQQEENILGELTASGTA